MLWKIVQRLRRLMSVLSDFQDGRNLARTWCSLALVGSLAVAIAGCDPLTERRYINEGAGVDLYTTNSAGQIELLNQYFNFLCDQVGGAGGSCGTYGTIVVAGMNDIDQRCDGYLTWLDAKRRDKELVVAELATLNTAIHSVMAITGASPKSLEILTAAFGLATDTYMNWTSRLLISVEQSTVQSVVYQAQKDYRNTIRAFTIADRPTAIYILRNYLRICMPISIEANINLSTKLVINGDVAAAQKNLVVRTTTAPLTARDTIGLPNRGGGGGTIGGGGTGGGRTGGGGTGGGGTGGDTSPVRNEAVAALVQDYNPKVQTAAKIQAVLRKLCPAETDLIALNENMNALIKVYQQTTGDAVTGRLTTPEIARLNNDPNCVPTEAIRNYYEKTRLTPAGIHTSDIMDQVNLVLPADSKLTGNVTVAQLRSAIKTARAALVAKDPALLQDPFLSDQMTADLAKALLKARLQPNR